MYINFIHVKIFNFFVFFFFFSGLHQWYMEVPRLGVESELQPQAYTTAMAMQNPSHICNPQLMATPEP